MDEERCFTIFPAIDLRGGRCVRLFQGDYAQETDYGDPVRMAEQWVEQGATWLHIVDLDGAKEGRPVNVPVIEEIVRRVPIPVQVGGGLRSLRDVSQLLSLGVSRVILGTAAIEDRPFIEQVLAQYGSKQILIGLDARDGYVATRGWLADSEVRADELARELVAVGIKTFVFTDIARDGTLRGPNLKRIRELVQTLSPQGAGVIASGGVSSLEDLKKLAVLSPLGVRGAIVGKVLYTGAIRLKEALKVVVT